MLCCTSTGSQTEQRPVLDTLECVGCRVQHTPLPGCTSKEQDLSCPHALQPCPQSLIRDARWLRTLAADCQVMPAPAGALTQAARARAGSRARPGWPRWVVGSGLCMSTASYWPGCCKGLQQARLVRRQHAERGAALQHLHHDRERRLVQVDLVRRLRARTGAAASAPQRPCLHPSSMRASPARSPTGAPVNRTHGARRGAPRQLSERGRHAGRRAPAAERLEHSSTRLARTARRQILWGACITI
jgi:hypothetical protein